MSKTKQNIKNKFTKEKNINKNEFMINIFEPKQIRTLVPSFFFISIIILLMIALFEPRTPMLVINELVIFAIYFVISLVFVLMAKKLVVEFYLFMSLSVFYLSVNFILLGLKISGLISSTVMIIFVVLYMVTLLVMFISRYKVLNVETENIRYGKNSKMTAFTVAVGSLGSFIGMMMQRTLSYNMGAVIVGVVSIIIGFIFEIAIIHNFYKWLILKNRRKISQI